MYSTKKHLRFILLLSFISLLESNATDSLIKINIVYDEPVNGYNVTGVFYPFDADGETGQVELKFTPVNGGRTLVFSNVGLHEEGHPDWPQKFTGKNIYDRLFQNGKRVPFVDGETLHCKYHNKNVIFEKSQLFYDAEFQFYDVDFDGQDEFLVNDYYRGRGGNNYMVYEITPDGFVLKDMEPFNDIINNTVFDKEKRTITNITDYYSGDKVEYTISKDGNKVLKKVEIEGSR